MAAIAGDGSLQLESPYAADALEALVHRYGSPLLLVDCDIVRRQYRALRAALPGVDLHYALKPLPERTVVEVLHEEGAWFDLATTGEVVLAREAGIPASRCIHTHPVKRDQDIRAALDFGLRTFVADNPDELEKLVPYAGRVEVLLRISFRSPAAVVDLSRKFGCSPQSAGALVDLAGDLGLRVAGLSFHVGSQSRRPDAQLRAIDACAALLRDRLGRGLEGPLTLDIGGGFPIDYMEPAQPIDEFCAPLRRALASLPQGTRVIAEPGRFICGPAGVLLTSVMGRAQRDGRWWYYLDDGLYGSFSGQLYDHARYPIEVLRRGSGPLAHCVLAGPTCDSIDVIAEDIELPLLRAGDILVGRQMGAYTTASATDFNFFPRARVVAVNR